MQNASKDNFILISTLVVVVGLAAVHMQSLVNVVFLMLCAALFLTNKRLLLLIYIIMLPTNGFISTKYNLFGILHVNYIINLFAFLALFSMRDEFSEIKIREVDEVRKCAYRFILLVYLYLMLNEYRLVFIGFNDTPVRLLITRSIRFTVMYVPLLRLTKLSVKEEYRQMIQKGYLISIGLIAFSIVFSGPLSQLGLTTKDVNKFVIAGGGFVRRSGFFNAGGDINSAAGFLAVGFGFLIFWINRQKRQRLYTFVVLPLIVLAIISTGSRMGLVSITCVFLLYLISREIPMRTKGAYIFLVLVLGIGVFFSGYLAPVLERFEDLKLGEGHLDTEEKMGRVGGWLFYLNYIFSNFGVLFFGTTESIYKGTRWYFSSYHRAAHNFYIQLWYYWGVFPVLYFIATIYKNVKYTWQSESKYRLLAIITPFLITLIFVSGVGVFLAVIIASIAVDNQEEI